jgi:uncharacterized protein
MTRKKFLQYSLRSTGALLLGTAAWGKYERHHLSVSTVPLSLNLGPEAPAEFTIAQLSDFHIDPEMNEPWLAEYVAATNALKPDIIALTGDYITGRLTAFDLLIPGLNKLQAPGGVWGCLGNHDQWNASAAHFTRLFGNSNIRMLINQNAAAEVNGGRVIMAGIESRWAGLISLPAAFSFHKKGSPHKAILLAHEPDVALEFRKDLPCALQLSGHTHGGQCSLPPGIPVRLPKYGTRFARGLYEKDHTWPIYVNRGIGTLNPHLRVASSPEITLFQIRNSNPSLVS